MTTASRPNKPLLRRPSYIGLLLFATVLRGPFVVVSTVTGELSTDLGMSATVIGLLTTLPVLCFGLAAPTASQLIGRLGVERAILLSLFGVLVGVLIRSAGGIPAAFLGTLVLGIAITVGNVVSPVLIGRDFRSQTATVTGSYTAMLNVGSMLTLSATGPMVSRLGWQLALVVWIVLPIIAAVVWIPLARRQAASRREVAPTGSAETSGKPPSAATQRESQPSTPAGAGTVAGQPGPTSARLSTVLRRGTTWMLMLAFAGQAFAYYGLTAWLPTLLSDEQGMTRDQAGAASSIFQVCGLIGAFATPVVINRLGGPLTAFITAGAGWASLPLGLFFAPDFWPLWSALGGAAQGAGFVSVFTVIVIRAKTLRENRQLSAIVQAGGYVIGCLGPVLVGGLNEGTGGWKVPLLTVLAAVATFATMGSLSARGIRR